ncbi:maltose acetyltransferase domain-containing protein [Novosphingobium resinovorum]
MERTEKQKMLAGEPYRASCPEIVADQRAAAEWMAAYNRTIDLADRDALLRERFAAVGEGRPSGRRSIATMATISAWGAGCS